MPDERKAISLRLSPEMWEQISRVAQHELRSINAQIEFMLREGLQRRGVGKGDERERDHATRGGR